LGLAAHGAAGGVQTLNNALGFSESASKQLEQLQSRIKSLQDGGDPVKMTARWISENKGLSEEEKVAIMSAAHAEKTLLQARQATGGATKGAVSSADTLLQSLRDQVAVLGMTDAQLQRYRLQMAGASKGQMDEVEALQATKKAYEDTERANKLYQKAMLEQKSIAEENTIFQTQKNQENVGLGIGERRRKQLAEEYQIRADFERRRRALEAGQEDESTRLDEPLYLQSIESLRSAEEEKLAIVRRSVQERSLLEQHWGLAMQEAMINYADNTANVYQAVSGLVGNIFKGMEDALFQFAMKGKMDFSSLADSIIADMIRIAIQQSVTAPLAGMIGNLFGGGVNGVSTASAIQQGGGDGIGALISLNGWASGGYTGDGGRYEPAGIVHKGEGVLSQDDMRSLGGRSGFERLRRSLRGYANGGTVGYPALPSATATGSMPGQDLQVVVNNYGGNRVEAKEEMSTGADGQMLRRVVISILDEQLGSPSTSTGRVLQRGWGLRARS
jgi:lambda family phage tail tape measure protein